MGDTAVASTEASYAEELVLAIGTGDEAKEGEFYERFYPTLLRYLSGQVSDVSRAEDFAHDTLIKVLIRLRERSLEQPAYLPRFVRQTARYSVLEWQRRKTNQFELRESLDETSSAELDNDSRLARSELHVEIRALINQLKMPRDREVLLRFYFYEQSKKVICEALELDAAHFDRVISRARRRLAAVIAEADGSVAEYKKLLMDQYS